MAVMIDSPKTYFAKLVSPRDSLLTLLEEEAEKENIPIVGPVVGEWLFILAGIANARNILELGTATGYSSIFLGRACSKNGGRVLTLELNPDMAARARKNIERAGLKDTVEVLRGDVLTEMEKMTGPFDMIFMDIEKKDYFRALPHCERLLKANGLLVADNTAFRDADAFNREIHYNPCWRSIHLYLFLPGHSPEQDGICLALRTDEPARKENKK
jgi:predicted O-methyltransferase YrrM